MNNQHKKKLLLVGNAYWVDLNRLKAKAFSRWFDVTCVSHSSNNHKIMGVKLDDSAAGEQESSLYQTYLLEPRGETNQTTRFTLKGLHGLMREVRPDIILVETEPWSYLFWQVVFGKLRYVSKAKLGLFSWENIRRPGLKGLILDQFYRACRFLLDFVIAGNVAAKELFKSGGVSADKIHVDAQLGFVTDHLPVDRAAHRVAMLEKWGSDTEALVIGFCGRFVPEKGIFDLLEAVENLRAPSASRQIELHFLGGGPLKSELEKLAEQKPWFKLLDPVPHDEVAGVMSAWDIFVLPSKRLEQDGELWEEQFGHVLLTSMGAECLTLGSDSGAIHEVLGNDEEVIFKADDVSSLQACLSGFLADGVGRKNKILEQRERAHGYYSYEQITERYHDHMNDCGIL